MNALLATSTPTSAPTRRECRAGRRRPLACVVARRAASTMAGSLMAVSLAARGVAAQAVDQRPPPQAAPAGAQARPPVAVPQATQWWCEINAQPAAALRTAAPIGVPVTKEDAVQNFFMSQIITRPARNGPDRAENGGPDLPKVVRGAVRRPVGPPHWTRAAGGDGRRRQGAPRR